MQTMIAQQNIATGTSKMGLPLPCQKTSTQLPAANGAKDEPQQDDLKVEFVSEPESRCLIEALSQSKTYQEYERAFSEATGMPVSLRSIESWQLPHHGKRQENDFCGLMAGKSRACAACLQIQHELTSKSTCEPATGQCHFGLTDSAVPLRVGQKLIGYVQTGQVFRKKPTEAQAEKMLRLLNDWGLKMDEQTVRDAFFKTPVVPQREYDSIVKLLSIFADHLSILTNKILVRQENSEPPVITKAKEYIKAHQSDDLSLGEVAKAVNTSAFYFCKMFKKATGLNFTDYVSRIRIERAKELLLNPNLRISEIAYEVGFQSLTHFNRVFRRIVGQTPTSYREQLPVF